MIIWFLYKTPERLFYRSSFLPSGVGFSEWALQNRLKKHL